MMHADERTLAPAPLLVLGLGNLLLSDDGVGLELLRLLKVHLEADPCVELLDGGTQGLALLPRLAGRRALLVLDAVAHGSGPGTVHHLRGAASCAAPRADRGGAAPSAHASSAGELFAVARLLGDLPPLVEVVGIEPAEIRTGIGLSAPARAALEPALELARQRVERLRVAAAQETACTR